MDGLLSNLTAPSQKAVLPSLQSTPEPSQQPQPSASQPDSPTIKLGSSIASLWLKVSQENQPPASIPSTLAASSKCPQCEQPLPPPLQSSGRQVCMKCGWSDKPRNSSSPNANPNSVPSEDAEPTDIDLLNLLEQAASESLNNMKPRKKPTR